MSRPWWYWWQWRDLPLLVISVVVLVTFVLGVGLLLAHLLLGFVGHVHHDLNQGQ